MALHREDRHAVDRDCAFFGLVAATDVGRVYTADPGAVEVEACGLSAVDGEKEAGAELGGVVVVVGGYSIIWEGVWDYLALVAAEVALLFDPDVVEVQVLVICEIFAGLTVVELGGGEG